MTKSDVKERVVHELHEYAITVAYLFVWLSALLLLENALQGEEGLAALPFGVAAGKALILGKFILLGQTLRVGARVAARTLVQRVAWRTLALLLVLAVLTLVEELGLGLVHGRSLGAVLAELTGQPLEHVARWLLMLLVLVPFVTAKHVSLALGPGAFRRLLLSPDAGEGPPQVHNGG